MSELLCSRPDWTSFRTLDGITTRAGVPRELLPRLVYKELADNTADASTSFSFDLEDDGLFWIEDCGPGLEGGVEGITSLYSLNRGFISSKMGRMPSRGALGNGLRVVVGAVLCSEGTLVVCTRGKRYELRPNRENGTTDCIRESAWRGTGTRVEVRLGPALEVEDDAPLAWVQLINYLAGKGTSYRGRSSPYWHTAESFWEWLQAAEDFTVRQLVAGRMDGCSAKASIIAGEYLDRMAASLTVAEAEDLLKSARGNSEAVNAQRLGQVGDLAEYDGSFRASPSTFTVTAARGKPSASIPYVIEAWARVAAKPSITVCVNRSPIPNSPHITRNYTNRTMYLLDGCNLAKPHHNACFKAVKKKEFEFLVNIQAPYLPRTSDGKQPDLRKLATPIVEALTKAAGRAHQSTRSSSGPKRTYKEFFRNHIEGIRKTISDDGKSRYGPRHLFYPYVELFKREFPKETPLWGTFQKLLTEYEDEVIKGDLPGIARDNRGTLYHPHLGVDIPLGTLTVEKYKRPTWTFNKILYIEKEGFFPILKDNRWPERHDCALLTSKGFATRAARDVIDLIGETGEPVTFFAAHDADGYGTTIYQKLEDATPARQARKFPVKNIGLDPWEAIDMGLRPEPVARKKGSEDSVIPVGDYVLERPDGREWWKFLQKQRVELNQMTPSQFLHWLDKKMEDCPDRKVIPPADVLPALTEEIYRERVTLFFDILLNGILSRADIVRDLSAQFLRAVPLDQALKWINRTFADDQSVPWRRGVACSIDGHLQGIACDFEAHVTRLLREALANR